MSKWDKINLVIMIAFEIVAFSLVAFTLYWAFN